jgi:F0F1-type ATP synthase membrane subunit b/b'
MFIASLIILQVIIFAAMIYMLKHILTRNVVSATKHLEELNQNYSQREDDIKKQLSESTEQSQQFLTNAKEEAEKFKAQIIQEAEEEKNKILQQVRQQGEEMIEQADKSRQNLIGELEGRIAKEAINKASELIQETLPEKFKQSVHTYWVEELIETGFSRTDRLRIPGDIKQAEIISAFALTETQRKSLVKKIKDILGADVEFKEEVDPKVIAGLVVKMGSLVLDGSLRNKIQECAKSK